MELLLSVALLAIFGVFALEYLSAAWLSSEKDISRIKCLTTSENILEMAGAMGIAEPDSLEETYVKIFSNSFDAPPAGFNVATWTLLASDSAVHPDGIGKFLAKIATAADQISSYSLFVGDANLANMIEIQSVYSTQSVTIDFGLDL